MRLLVGLFLLIAGLTLGALSSVSFYSLSDGSVTNSTNFTASYSDLSELVNVSFYRLSGASWVHLCTNTSGSGGFAWCVYNIAEEWNATVNVTVTNGTDVLSSRVTGVIYDNAQPSITVASPGTGNYSDTVNITWNATDITLQSARWRFVNATNSGENFTAWNSSMALLYNTSSLPNGALTLAFSGVDTFRTVQSNVNVTVDHTAPVLENARFNGSFPDSDRRYTVNATFYETNIRNVTFSLYYGNGTSHSNRTMTTYVGLNVTNVSFVVGGDGNYTFLLNATNGAGVSTTLSSGGMANGTSTQALFVDFQSPEVSFISPSRWTGEGNGTALTLSANITDLSNVDTTGLTAYLDGYNTSFLLTAITYSGRDGYRLTATNSSLRNGDTYVFKIDANDTLNNSVSANISFTVDSGAPIAANASLTGTEVDTDTYRTNFSLVWSAGSDVISSVRTYDVLRRSRNFSVGFTEWTGWASLSNVSNDTFAYRTNGTDDRQYQFKVVTSDQVNNTNASGIVNVTFDLHGPDLVAINGDSGIGTVYWTNQTNLTLAVNLSDISSIGNASLAFSFNGSSRGFTVRPVANESRSYKVMVALTNLDNATNYTSYIAANDSLNTSVNVSFSVNTDFTAPNITVTLLSTPVFLGWYRDSATVQVNCSDGESGVNGTYTNETGYNNWSDVASFNYSISSDGNQTYLFSCRDGAGNIGSATAQIAIDSVAPMIDESSETPSSGSSGVAVSTTIRLNFNENASGVNSTKTYLELKKGSDAWANVSYGVSSSSVSYTTPNYGFETTIQVRAVIVDHVAHSDVFSWSYTTKSAASAPTSSGGGGGSGGSSTKDNTSTSLLQITDIPSIVVLRQNTSINFSVTVKNTASTLLVNVSFAMVSPFNSTVFPEVMDIPGGSSTAVIVQLRAGEFEEVRDTVGTFLALSGDSSDQRTVKVSVLPPESSFSIVGPSYVRLNRTENVSLPFELLNTGGSTLGAIVATMFGDLDVNLSGIPGELLANEKKPFFVRVSAPESVTSGNHTLVLQVVSGEVRFNHSFVVFVPFLSEEVRDVNVSLRRLRQEVQTFLSSNITNLSDPAVVALQERMGVLLDLFESGDIRSTQTEITAVEKELEVLKGRYTASLIIPWTYVVALLIIVLASGSIYFTQTYEGRIRLAKLKKRTQDWFRKRKSSSSGGIASIKKKIEFDDL